MDEVQELIISDCKIQGFSLKECEEYFKVKGHPLSQSRIKELLREFNSDGQINIWLDYQSRIGFVTVQRDMITNIIENLKIANREMKKEMEKEDTIEVETKNGTMTITNPAKSKQYISSLMREITSMNKRLEELNLGNPIIYNIRKRLESKERPELMVEHAAGTEGIIPQR